MMKKLIIFCLVLFTVNAAMAQGPKIDFGPRITLTSTQINFKDNINNFQEGDAEFGYQFGVFLRAKLLGLYIQPELLLSSSQSTITEVGVGEVSLDFNTIDIPVMIGYKIGPIRLQAGPAFSVLTKAENQLGNDVKDLYNDLTVGFQAGAGVDLLKFVFDLKYEGNLSAFGDAVPGGINTDQRVSQLVFAVGFKLL